MTKEEAVMLRISTEDKATIKAAADSVNKSLTTFITEAALKQARQVKRRPPAKGIHGGVPTFFRALCAEAANGGAHGYSVPGSHLANALGSAAPDDLDNDEWQVEIDELTGLLADDDDKPVLAWFVQHFPKCMALVPARRRAQFVVGVRAAHEEGRVG
jgi:hypothetical protein